jgi:TetR/AcrR family transcriptional regulator, regulator of autoinduction and epiphytic fitness
MIAREAGVAVETIYRGFGGKTELFKEVVEAAVAGGASRAEVAVEDRPAIRAIIEEPDPVRQLQLYARTQPGIHRRSGPLLRTLRDAAPTDERLAQLWKEIEHSRLNGLGRLAAMLESRGSLRADIDVDHARDVVWTMCSLSVWDLLVTERGWNEDRYVEWLANTLADALLPRTTISGQDRSAITR